MIARLTDSRMVDTPLELNAKIQKDDESPLTNPTVYWHIVGSLI